jgi:hypothetical protein
MAAHKLPQRLFNSDVHGGGDGAIVCRRFAST